MELNSEKVSLIVGAGAVENAWQPIINVLQPDYDFDFDIDSANSFLTLLVYQLRFFATDTNPNSKEYLKAALMDFNEIKSRISRELNKFQQDHKIYPRKEFSDILDKFIFHKHIEYVLITTNWDTVIDDAINYYGHSTVPNSNGRIEVFHLHGITSIPNGLYLPSEIAREPYRFEQESSSIIKNLAATFRAIEESKRIILYGLSLDPLDAELSQILSIGFNSRNTKEIIIINPDHKKIAKRVKLLLNNSVPNVDIFAYSPQDLTSKIQY